MSEPQHKKQRKQREQFNWWCSECGGTRPEGGQCENCAAYKQLKNTHSGAVQKMYVESNMKRIANELFPDETRDGKEEYN